MLLARRQGELEFESRIPRGDLKQLQGVVFDTAVPRAVVAVASTMTKGHQPKQYPYKTFNIKN
jgi:hypothetical protein